MNLALIALPSAEKVVFPPLTLAYIATILEQRRHIVRIYDLALTPSTPVAAMLQPLRVFRPHIVIVAGDKIEPFHDIIDMLHAHHQNVLTVCLNRNGIDVGQMCPSVLHWIDTHSVGNTKQNTTASPNPAAVQQFMHLDALPVPARHLLQLEDYNLRAVGGELQTTLLIGTIDDKPEHGIALRSPEQIVAELRSVSSEFGLRHYLFPDIPMTIDPDWLHELLTRLSDADLNIGWEAGADVEYLDEHTIKHMATSGCELLHASLDAARVFESTQTRLRLKQSVAYAEQHGVRVRADVMLGPPYESVPHLVDVAATFGLSDVTFSVVPPVALSVPEDSTKLEAMARQRYDAGRDRQRLIERFGSALGNLIWKLRGSPAPSMSTDRTTQFNAEDEGVWG